MTPERFATERHGEHRRKGSDRLYIVHPEGVARILASRYPDQPELTDAGWLHDTIEDTPTTADEIEAVATALNSRPCKTLGWRTPAEALNGYLLSSQQTSVATTT